MNVQEPRLFAMECPHCGVRLKVKSTDIGSRRACPKCRQAITVGATQSEKKSGPQPQDEFPIKCSLCATVFYATPDQVGKKIDCPDCLTEHTVPAAKLAKKQKTRRPSTAPDDINEYQLQPLESPGPAGATAANSAPIKTFHFPCSLCGTMMVAKPELIGQSVTCPDCHSRVVVTKRAPKPVANRVVAKDPKIGVGAAHDLEKVRQNSAKLMRAAHDHQAQLERQRPQPPKRPFLDGVYTFPLRPRVMPVWVLLSPILLIATGLIASGLQAEGLSAIGAVLMFGLAGFLFLLIAVGAGHGFLTLLQATAMGYDQPAEWGGFDLLAWFGKAAYLVSAFVLSVLPVLLLSGFLSPLVRTIVGGLLCFFLFPFLLLSMMDAGSPAVPFSSYVWNTLGRGAEAWTKFYVSTGVLAAAIVALLAAVSLLPGVWGFVLSTVAGVMSMTVYFRLLGRLAWVLDQLPVDADEAVSE